MDKEFTKVEVEQPMFGRKEGGAETGNKFNRPTRRSRYLHILSKCVVPLSAKDLFPNVRHPIMKQVRDMCRAGLLDRLKADGERRYYYKTTAAGLELLAKAMSGR